MTKIAEKINKKRETQLKQVENIYAKLLENKNPSPKTVLEPENDQNPVQVISMDVNGTFVPSEEFSNKEKRVSRRYKKKKFESLTWDKNKK